MLRRSVPSFHALHHAHPRVGRKVIADGSWLTCAGLWGACWVVSGDGKGLLCVFSFDKLVLEGGPGGRAQSNIRQQQQQQQQQQTRQTAGAQGPAESWQPGLLRRMVSCTATENNGAAELQQPGLNYSRCADWSSAQPLKTSRLRV